MLILNDTTDSALIAQVFKILLRDADYQAIRDVLAATKDGDTEFSRRLTVQVEAIKTERDNSKTID